MAKLVQTTVKETEITWKGLANLIKGGGGEPPATEAR